MAKNSLRIWELELWLSTKMGLAIRNSVTPGQNSGQGHTEVFQDRFHLEQSSQGSIKDVESLYYTTGAEAGFKKETHECCQHYFRICRCWRSACQCSDHTPHTATSRFAWPSSQKEASSEAAGTEELRFVEGNMDSNMYCDILKQKMMPSLQKLFSIITTTPKTQPRWQLTYCWRWRWWSGQVCLQTWTLLSTCGASSSGRWRSTVSNIQQLRDVIIYGGGEEDDSNNLCSSGEFHSQED